MSEDTDRSYEIEALKKENAWLQEQLDASKAALRGMVAKDPIVEANRQALLDRSNVGLAKYGVGLDREDLSDVQWMQHLLEELLDAANYAQAFIKHRSSWPANLRVQMQGKRKGEEAWTDISNQAIFEDEWVSIRKIYV